MLIDLTQALAPAPPLVKQEGAPGLIDLSNISEPRLKQQPQRPVEVVSLLSDEDEGEQHQELQEQQGSCTRQGCDACAGKGGGAHAAAVANGQGHADEDDFVSISDTSCAMIDDNDDAASAGPGMHGNPSSMHTALQASSRQQQAGAGAAIHSHVPGAAMEAPNTPSPAATPAATTAAPKPAALAAAGAATGAAAVNGGAMPPPAAPVSTHEVHEQAATAAAAAAEDDAPSPPPAKRRKTSTSTPRGSTKKRAKDPDYTPDGKPSSPFADIRRFFPSLGSPGGSRGAPVTRKLHLERQPQQGRQEQQQRQEEQAQQGQQQEAQQRGAQQRVRQQAQQQQPRGSAAGSQQQQAHSVSQQGQQQQRQQVHLRGPPQSPGRSRRRTAAASQQHVPASALLLSPSPPDQPLQQQQEQGQQQGHVRQHQQPHMQGHSQSQQAQPQQQHAQQQAMMAPPHAAAAGPSQPATRTTHGMANGDEGLPHGMFEAAPNGAGADVANSHAGELPDGILEVQQDEEADARRRAKGKRPAQLPPSFKDEGAPNDGAAECAGAAGGLPTGQGDYNLRALLEGCPAPALGAPMTSRAAAAAAAQAALLRQWGAADAGQLRRMLQEQQEREAVLGAGEAGAAGAAKGGRGAGQVEGGHQGSAAEGSGGGSGGDSGGEGATEAQHAQRRHQGQQQLLDALDDMQEEQQQQQQRRRQQKRRRISAPDDSMPAPGDAAVTAQHTHPSSQQQQHASGPFQQHDDHALPPLDPAYYAGTAGRRLLRRQYRKTEEAARDIVHELQDPTKPLLQNLLEIQAGMYNHVHRPREHVADADMFSLLAECGATAARKCVASSAGRSPADFVTALKVNHARGSFAPAAGQLPVAGFDWCALGVAVGRCCGPLKVVESMLGSLEAEAKVRRAAQRRAKAALPEVVNPIEGPAAADGDAGQETSKLAEVMLQILKDLAAAAAAAAASPAASRALASQPAAAGMAPHAAGGSASTAPAGAAAALQGSAAGAAAALEGSAPKGSAAGPTLEAAALEGSAAGAARYAELVVNHDERRGFALTIENDFALSFLVRDGRVSLEASEDLGLLVRYQPPSATQQQRARAAAAQRHQFVQHIDYQQWELMRALVRRGDALMPHRLHFNKLHAQEQAARRHRQGHHTARH